VLTAPEWYTQSQRDLLKQLATLAGYHVQAVIGELSAVAIDFATRNGGDDAQRIIFLSVGTHGRDITYGVSYDTSY
jgi:molecular chaperone DnaK (HSP70)